MEIGLCKTPQMGFSFICPSLCDLPYLPLPSTSPFDPPKTAPTLPLSSSIHSYLVYFSLLGRSFPLTPVPYSMYRFCGYSDCSLLIKDLAANNHI